MQTKEVESILRCFKQMKQEKQPMMPVYQALSEFIMYHRYDFHKSPSYGDFIIDKVSDDTAAKAAQAFSAHMIGATWPNGAQSINVRPPRMVRLSGQVTESMKQWFRRATQTLVSYMDDPKARLSKVLEQYYLEQSVFGLSGIGVFDNTTKETPLLYTALGAKALYIREAANGFVDSIYIEKLYTLHAAASEFGISALPATYRERLEKGDKDATIIILHVVEPRDIYNPKLHGALNMPYKSVYIHPDTKHVLYESGYDQRPFAIGRFWQVADLTYPRSPGMNALPSIFELNHLREGNIIATELQYNPSMAVWDEGVLGRGLDKSPGSTNVFSQSGRISQGNRPPVEPMFTVGDLNYLDRRILQVQEDIKDHYFNNRLFDLDKSREMTLGEAQMLDRLRGQALNPIYSGQIADVLLPITELSFNRLFMLGYFGVVPGSEHEAQLLEAGQPLEEQDYVPEDVMQLVNSGQEFYDIQFISPAARLLQFEELQGLHKTVELGAGLASMVPDAIDIVDFDKLYKMAIELNTANGELLRSDTEVADIRQQRAEQQQRMMELEAQKLEAEGANQAATAASRLK